MSDKTPEAPSRNASDAERRTESERDGIDRESRDTTSDIERAAEPSPRDPAMDFNYTHDDPDRQRDGLHDVPFTEEFENVARRDEIVRQVDDAVQAARSWARESNDPDAQEIVDLLVEASDRLGRPTEETSVETAMDRGGQEPSKT